MAAFVVVELEVIDAVAKERYSEAAAPTILEFGGEFVAAGEWTLLAGQPNLRYGAIIRFKDRDQALAWYNSPDYQSVIVDRDRAMKCRFQVVG